MAYDEGVADTMRTDLADEPGIEERKMFGGLCILRYGHMVCGAHARGAMYRVGKPAMAQALAIPGCGPMNLTGRPMGGIVGADPHLLADDHLRLALHGLAISHARSLPPK